MAVGSKSDLTWMEALTRQFAWGGGLSGFLYTVREGGRGREATRGQTDEKSPAEKRSHCFLFTESKADKKQGADGPQRQR